MAEQSASWADTSQACARSCPVCVPAAMPPLSARPAFLRPVPGPRWLYITLAILGWNSYSLSLPPFLPVQHC